MTGSPGALPIPDPLDRVLVWSGAAAAVVAFSAIFLSTLLAPWFSWTGNALSGLGGSSVAYAPLFNWGMVVGGLLGSVFVVRAAPTAENAAEWLGAAVLLGATLSLLAIGVFPIGHRPHGPASVSFFVLLTYGLVLHGTGEVLAGRIRAGLAGIWLGLANATGWFAWALAASLTAGGDPGVAIPELVGAVAIASWVIPTTRRLRRRRERSRPEESPGGERVGSSTGARSDGPEARSERES